MSAFWHPLSSIFFPDPPVPATPGLLRKLLGRGRPIEVLSAGDRMFPAILPGARLRIVPPGGDAIRPGEVVLCDPDGATDLLRVRRVTGSGLLVSGDADVSPPIEIPAGAVLGRLHDDARASIARHPFPGSLIRLALDLREAIEGRASAPDADYDPALSVRVKYGEQAASYGRSGSGPMEAALLSRLRASVREGGRILVVGSGSGRECFALERAGWRATGLDFSGEMTGVARAQAARLGSSVPFLHADIREHDEPAGSLSAVLFTYDAYSFLPARARRVSLLARMRGWLEPGGCIVLSARRTGGLRARVILTLQFLNSGAAEWGDSHTRWVRADAGIGRAYLHRFTSSGLDGEIAEAGMEVVSWQGGHGVLRPAGHLYFRAP